MIVNNILGLFFISHQKRVTQVLHHDTNCYKLNTTKKMISTKWKSIQNQHVYPSNFPKIDHIPKAIASITEQNPKDKRHFLCFEENIKLRL